MAEHTTGVVDIALLAPVPKEHLVEGRQTSLTMGKVAFGSRAYDVFLKLDEERGGKPVDVYIYESYGGGHYDPKVSWKGRYLGFVGAVGGAHPDGMKFRPTSTAKYPGDNEGGDWLIFWEVDRLENVPEAERMHVGKFVPNGKTAPYGISFVPRGPVLIECP